MQQSHTEATIAQGDEKVARGDIKSVGCIILLWMLNLVEVVVPAYVAIESMVYSRFTALRVDGPQK